MDASRWLTWGFHRRWLSVLQSVSLGGFALGTWLGIMAVTLWQQWSLTFGQDPDFLLVVAVMLSASLLIGAAWQRSRLVAHRSGSLTSLVVCLSVWCVIHPFWIDVLTMLVGQMPVVWLENSVTRLVMNIVLAALGWVIPGVLWSAVLTAWEQTKCDSGSANRRRISALYLGIAGGLILNAIVLSPWLGLFPAALTASIPACLLCWFNQRGDHEPRLGGPSPIAESTDGILMRGGALFFLGCLMACHLRLTNQLMPHGAFVFYVQLAGIAGGIGVGVWLASMTPNLKDRTAWGILVALSASGLLLGLHPQLVSGSLWVNSTFSVVSALLAARVLLMFSVACPFGFSLAWIADSTTSESRPSVSGWCGPFAAGVAAATFALCGFVDLLPLIAGSTVLLTVAGGFLRFSSTRWAGSWQMSIGITVLAATSLSLPLWRTCIDPSRTAKMLYSAPTFMAYRTGWEPRYLSALDDIRMIDHREGRTGPLTLWRGHVAELFVRDAGVPRAVVSKQSEIVPQYAPEVLQAVYSLVLADRPGRVLVLGLSAGVPLSTCLYFPIHEVVCVEGDANLIDFVRGPLALETGFDPLSDDRVTLQRVSPEMALMTRPAEPFDVVLSCPGVASLTDRAAEFTQEFYQHASARLSSRGLFCQRFECVDYGPEPIQMVLKAIQGAFRRVMVIETSTGELLLFAANSDDLFVSEELARRLEISHVAQILARSGLDWSVLLNQATLDHDAIREICNESRWAANSRFNGLLASRSPLEVMRWGNKQQEVQKMLTADRTSPAPAPIAEARQRSGISGQPVSQSRRSRLIEWLDESQVTRELLRRLEEVAAQQKIVQENPDEHWWKYRKELRKQLQERPRTAVQQVKAIDEKRKTHPEDVRRRNYFLALGNAATQSQPSRDEIAKVESYLEPYDPLLSYFARQEAAELLGRTGADPVTELMYRLHVIYFAPGIDGSVRNVSKAIVTLVKHPETIPDDAMRFDTMNGLIQTLRVRWEIRQTMVESSSNKLLEDVDQSLLAVEKGVAVLDAVHTSAGVKDSDWQTRRQVIERLLQRPLRAYRAEVHARQMRGEAQTKTIIDDALDLDDGAE